MAHSDAHSICLKQQGVYLHNLLLYSFELQQLWFSLVDLLQDVAGGTIEAAKQVGSELSAVIVEAQLLYFTFIA